MVHFHYTFFWGMTHWFCKTYPLLWLCAMKGLHERDTSLKAKSIKS